MCVSALFLSKGITFCYAGLAGVVMRGRYAVLTLPNHQEVGCQSNQTSQLLLSEVKNQNAGSKTRPGRFPRIGGNAGNHGNDEKFHESHQIYNQIKRNINKLFSRKTHVKK